MADDKPIIVVKKKGGHGGHHGGAWKVAYADFVTAMMAFFMVMWLVNSAETSTKKNIAKYFRRPGIFQEGSGTPLLMGQAGILEDAYVPPHSQETKNFNGMSQEPQKDKSGTDKEELEKSITLKGTGSEGIVDTKKKGQGLNPSKTKAKPSILEEPEHATAMEVQFPATEPGKANQKGEAKLLQGMGDRDAGDKGIGDKVSGDKGIGDRVEGDKGSGKAALAKLAQEIKEEIRRQPELENMLGKMEVKLESDGLVIEIMDTDKSSMFALGSAAVLPEGEQAFAPIAELLAKLPNKIDIIGHTDGKPFSARNGYSNWELSADRANAARRVLVAYGVDPARIVGVIGRADQDLKKPEDPLNAANRRITLKLRYAKDIAVPADEAQSALFDLQQEQSTSEKAEAQPAAAEAETAATAAPAAATPTPQPSPPAGYAPWKKVGVGDRVLINAAESKRRTIKLPEPDAPPASSSTPDTKDKIFGDNPVIGPGAAFGNY